MSMKDNHKRIIRTFLQAACGAFAANAAGAFSGVTDDRTFATAMLSVLAVAVSTGIAAVMNREGSQSVE